jgi:acyl-coenzyme A thioesterase PaaI-like protein
VQLFTFFQGYSEEVVLNKNNTLSAEIMEIIRSKYGDRINEYKFPPPVFGKMEGKFIALDLEKGTLSTQFPVLEDDLNPYGTMQGGMIAAAVDNTFGPLSVLIAPPNVTRELTLKYSHPVTLDTGHITITARFLGSKDRRLHFTADVRNKEGLRLARANAVHVLID